MARSNPRPRRQRRETLRAKDKHQKKIRQAMTNDLLDTVLAEYSCQDNLLDTDGSNIEVSRCFEKSPPIPIPRTDASEATTGEMVIDNSDLNRLHQQLFPPDTADSIQLIFDQIAGKAFPTSQANKRIVLQINQILAGTGLKCAFKETGQKIRLRFINPPRSKHGYFQLRTSNAQQIAVFTNSQFPSLQVLAAHLL